VDSLAESERCSTCQLPPTSLVVSTAQLELLPSMVLKLVLLAQKDSTKNRIVKDRANAAQLALTRVQKDPNRRKSACQSADLELIHLPDSFLAWNVLEIVTPVLHLLAVSQNA